ncbi:MAG: transcriptional regulator [Hyphomicrobiaceae bacterium]
MSTQTESRLSETESFGVSQRVREELARRRITRQQLAVDAKISLSTLEKALSGKRPFTLTTTVRLEEALGIALRSSPPPNAESNDQANVVNGLAPEGLGCYARPAVKWIEGDYLTLRPSFGDADALYAYRTEISWNGEDSCLAFREADRIDSDFTQWGQVSIPHQSGHIYLVTNRHGQYRLIVVARPTITGEMHGILTTLQAGRGAQLTPVSTPIVFVPMPHDTSMKFGRLSQGDNGFDTYKSLLQSTVDETYVRFLTP